MARTVPPLTRVLAAVAAVAVAGGAGFLATRDDDPSPSGYRLVYAVEVDGRATTETVEVLGLSSRRVSDATGSATTLSGVYDRVDGSWRQLAVVAPGEAGSRLQLTAVLAWAESAGRARRDGAGEVAGVTCTWWVTRDPLDSAPVAAAEPADRTRSCVDAEGRLLADEWTAGGRVVRTRAATAVEPISSLEPFDGTTPAALDPRLATTAVTGAEPEGGPPAGCTWVHGAQVVEGAPGTTDVVRRIRRSVGDCSGTVLVLDRVSVPTGVPAPTGDVPLEGLQGTVRGTGGGLVVEVLDGTDLLRVRADLPLAQLVPWMRSQAARD